MKRILSLLVIATILLTLTNIPAWSFSDEAPSSPLATMADEPAPAHRDPPGELMIADALIVRPIGIVACVVGLAGALVTWPFAATSNTPDPVGRELLQKPFSYTFERPLGQFDW